MSPPISLPPIQPPPLTAGTVTNATVTVLRGGADVAGLAATRVFVAVPTHENFGFEGEIVTTTLTFPLLPPDTTIRSGDRVRFESLDGHPDLDQTTVRTVKQAMRVPGPVPTVRVWVEALIQ